MDGVVVWVVNDATINGSETGTSFRQALFFMENGFNLHDTMIYEKTNPIPQNHNRYEQCFEYMFVFSKGKPKTFNPKSILNFERPHPPIHPTQKPVPLFEYLIKTYTNEGDCVLDNTMGSGSTGVAAMNTGRNFIGIEKEEDYFKIAQERIAEAESFQLING